MSWLLNRDKENRNFSRDNSILFKDEEGLVLDINGATTKEILLRKPDGTTVALQGVFVTDGTDGLLKFITNANTFNISGKYTIQGHIISTSSDWHSTKDTFIVSKNVI